MYVMCTCSQYSMLYMKMMFNTSKASQTEEKYKNMLVFRGLTHMYSRASASVHIFHLLCLSLSIFIVHIILMRLYNILLKILGKTDKMNLIYKIYFIYGLPLLLYIFRRYDTATQANIQTHTHTWL
jgi:ABC-type antimicrobial peptide transport system permease subunit